MLKTINDRLRQMTDHPCKGMTKGQRAAFERVAINQPPYASDRTLKALLDRGVVTRGEDKVVRDGLGEFRIPTYIVPLPIHAQWCEWCSEQPDTGID